MQHCIPMKDILLIGLGGFLGSTSRYFTQVYVDQIFMSKFPAGTYLVNIAGCFFIGLIYGFAEREHLLHAETRMFLAVGFCGSFTTFSTFAHENLKLMSEGNIITLLTYTLMSVALGIFFTYLGIIIARSM